MTSFFKNLTKYGSINYCIGPNFYGQNFCISFGKVYTQKVKIYKVDRRIHETFICNRKKRLLMRFLKNMGWRQKKPSLGKMEAQVNIRNKKFDNFCLLLTLQKMRLALMMRQFIAMV